MAKANTNKKASAIAEAFLLDWEIPTYFLVGVLLIILEELVVLGAIFIFDDMVVLEAGFAILWPIILVECADFLVDFAVILDEDFFVIFEAIFGVALAIGFAIVVAGLAGAAKAMPPRERALVSARI